MEFRSFRFLNLFFICVTILRRKNIHWVRVNEVARYCYGFRNSWCYGFFPAKNRVVTYNVLYSFSRVVNTVEKEFLERFNRNVNIESFEYPELKRKHSPQTCKMITVGILVNIILSKRVNGWRFYQKCTH